MAAALTSTAPARELACGPAATRTATAGPAPAWALTLGTAAKSALPGSGMNVVPGPMIVVQRYEYTGRELASESGEYYFRYRVYGPSLGQFFTRDPLGYVETVGLYGAGYAETMGIDPLGLLDPTLWWQWPWDSTTPWLSGAIDATLIGLWPVSLAGSLTGCGGCGCNQSGPPVIDGAAAGSRIKVAAAGAPGQEEAEAFDAFQAQAEKKHKDVSPGVVQQLSSRPAFEVWYNGRLGEGKCRCKDGKTTGDVVLVQYKWSKIKGNEWVPDTFAAWGNGGDRVPCETGKIVYRAPGFLDARPKTGTSGTPSLKHYRGYIDSPTNAMALKIEAWCRCNCQDDVKIEGQQVYIRYDPTTGFEQVKQFK